MVKDGYNVKSYDPEKRGHLYVKEQHYALTEEANEALSIPFDDYRIMEDNMEYNLRRAERAEELSGELRRRITKLEGMSLRDAVRFTWGKIVKKLEDWEEKLCRK